MSVDTNKEGLKESVAKYLDTAKQLQDAILEETPKKLQLINLCLNKLSEMVARNGYLDRYGKYTPLSLSDITTILSALNKGHQLQANIAAIPNSFLEATKNTPPTAETNINLNVPPALPRPLTPIDITVQPRIEIPLIRDQEEAELL